MAMNAKLADDHQPLVRETAHRLTLAKQTDREKLEGLFYYVRDEIKFGFPLSGDLTPASATIRLQMGQCNTKGTLFLALCKVAGIPARIHFSLIDKRIQKGLFPGLMYWLLPPFLSHSWVEVQVDGRWRRIDSYINDRDFYQAGKQALGNSGWDTGFSIACSGGPSGIELNLEEEAFVQMGAVTEDHGVWEDPADYYATDLYKNRPSAIKLLFYRWRIGKVNQKVAQMRQSCAGGLCGNSSAGQPDAASSPSAAR
jgi:hypothetical protein